MPTQPSDRRPKKTATTRRTTTTGSGGSDEKYAASSWGVGVSGETLEDVEVPSGQLCLARRPGVEGLLKAGILHQLDSLTSLVQANLNPSTGAVSAEAALSQVMGDPEKLAEMMRIVDKVVMYVVVKPEIQSTPDDVTRRENNVIYADMIELEDKMFLLNYAVGGTRDLERFRGEHAASMGALANVQGAAPAPKRRSPRTR